MAHKRIGILTGGGDVPGLNLVIKSVVYRGAEDKCEVVGIRRGWEGLTHVNFDDPASMARYIMPLTTDNTRTGRSQRWHVPAFEPHQSIEDEEPTRLP